MEDAKVIATCLAVYYALATPVGVGVLRFAYKICNKEAVPGDRGQIGIQNAAYVCLVSNVVFHAGVLGIWAYNNRWHSDWGTEAMLSFYGVSLLFYFGSCLVKSVLLTRVTNSPTGATIPTMILDQIMMFTIGFVEIGKAFAQKLFNALSAEFSCEVSVKEASTDSVDIGFTVWNEPSQDTVMSLIKKALGSDQEVHLQPGTSI